MNKTLISHILGIPLNEESISEQFKNFISNQDNTIFLSVTDIYDYHNQDMICAAVGFDEMMIRNKIPMMKVDRETINSLFFAEDNRLEISQDSNKIFLAIDLYRHGDQSFGPEEIVKKLIHLVEKIDCKEGTKFVLTTPGSPLVDDFFCEKLLDFNNDIIIINTKSSVDLAEETFDLDLPTHKIFKSSLKESIQGKKEIFKKDHMNIIATIGDLYVNDYACDIILEETKHFNNFYILKFGYDNFKLQLAREIFEYNFKEKRDRFNDLTLAIF